MAYDEDYGCYYDPYEATDFEIYVYENNGWTLLEIYGPTITEEEDYTYTEQELLDEGFTKQSGWPTQTVADTMTGSNYTFPSFKEDADWFVNAYLQEGFFGDDYYIAKLATKGLLASEYCALLDELGLSLYVDGDFYRYSDPTSASNFQVQVYEMRGYTFIEFYGPTLD